MTESEQPRILGDRLAKGRLSFTQKFFVFLGILFGIFLLCLALFVISLGRTHSDREISGELTLSSEWVEITPDQPLSFPKQFQGMVLDVAEPLVKDNLQLESVQLMNGTLVHPELQLVEQNGNVVKIKLQSGPTPSQHDNSVDGFVSRPAEGRVYTKVRVRCDRQLRLSRIIWHSWDGK
jgi:hypothetical protein